MTVHIDQILESRATQTVAGLDIERIAIVSGATGTAAGKIIRALTAAGLPAFGDPHPDWPSSTLQEMQASPVVNDQTTRVRMTYRPDQGQDVHDAIASFSQPDFVTSIEISSSLQSDITNRDINDELMTVNYVGQPTRADQVGGRIVILREVVEVEYQRPSLQVRFRVNHQTIPKLIATDYIGSVNANAWSGFPPETWLLTDVDSSLTDGLWRTSYRMLYRPQTWRVDFAIKFLGQTPLDISEGNGIEFYQIYPVRDWSDLKVSF